MGVVGQLTHKFLKKICHGHVHKISSSLVQLQLKTSSASATQTSRVQEIFTQFFKLPDIFL